MRPSLIGPSSTAHEYLSFPLLLCLPDEELRRRSVDTAAGLAAVPLPLTWKPDRGAVSSYERVREQARVQGGGP